MGRLIIFDVRIEFTKNLNLDEIASFIEDHNPHLIVQPSLSDRFLIDSLT